MKFKMYKIYTFLVLTYFVGCYYAVAARSSLHIVNGTNAADGEFPHMVQLRLADETVQCAGSIISPNWILTAANCLKLDAINHIVYGFNQQTSSPKTSIKIKQYFTHPSFIIDKNGVIEYDVGLIQLSQPIPLGGKAKSVQLVKAGGAVPFHVKTTYAGWGQTSYYNKTGVPLKKIKTQILTDVECANAYNKAAGKNIWIAGNNVCNENLSTGICFGDFGGPLVVNGIQYGITSWVYKPCEVMPAAFVRLDNSKYRNWIKQMTKI